MNHKELAKKNITSLHLLKTLQVLYEDNYTMAEIVDILNETEKSPIFNRAVVSKYINTLRNSGFEITKINNVYYLTKMPFGMDLLKGDIKLIEFLYHIVSTRMSNKNKSTFSKFISKLNRHSNSEILKVEEDNESVIFEDFENAIRDRRSVTFILKNKKTINCIPIRLIEEKKPVQFLVLVDGKEVIISANTVSAINTTSKIHAENFTQQAVLFKLTGNLAKRYTLREMEHLVEKRNDFIIVSNSDECKEILLNRLLKYDTCCEILSPKSYRKDMLDIINATLKNYEEE